MPCTNTTTALESLYRYQTLFWPRSGNDNAAGRVIMDSCSKPLEIGPAHVRCRSGMTLLTVTLHARTCAYGAQQSAEWDQWRLSLPACLGVNGCFVAAEQHRGHDA